ncbi:hypothetical protein BC826DRAFT_1066983 [Russula brevipes]|nr:hypothetical protein BC826DRAFT_1066983 [Russula brevipes]
MAVCAASRVFFSPSVCLPLGRSTISMSTYAAAHGRQSSASVADTPIDARYRAIASLVMVSKGLKIAALYRLVLRVGVISSSSWDRVVVYFSGTQSSGAAVRRKGSRDCPLMMVPLLVRGTRASTAFAPSKWAFWYPFPTRGIPVYVCPGAVASYTLLNQVSQAGIDASGDGSFRFGLRVSWPSRSFSSSLHRPSTRWWTSLRSSGGGVYRLRITHPEA